MSLQARTIASLGVIVPSVWTRSSKVAKSGWGILYAEKTIHSYLRRRCERRLPSVWSSLLKVNMAVLGTPGAGLVNIADVKGGERTGLLLVLNLLLPVV